MQKRINIGAKGRLSLSLLSLLVIVIIVLSLFGKRLFHSLIQKSIEKSLIELHEEMHFSHHYRFGPPVLVVSKVGKDGYNPIFAVVTYKSWAYTFLRLRIHDRQLTDWGYVSDELKNNIKKIIIIMWLFGLDDIIVNNDQLVYFRFTNALDNYMLSIDENVDKGYM